jgi:3'(2'), 5'-bisphosphate nucleotidase/myo-inositol-1(or 4)-monophosphatase
MTPLTDETLSTLSQLAIFAATAAGEIIARHYQEPVEVRHKDRGDSIASQVVTEIDHRAQAAILEIIEPSCDRFNLAMLAEESTDSGERLTKPAFWSIDPLDGTLAFIRQQPGFAVSIALVTREGEPLIGVVLDPVEKHLCHAVRGGGIFKNGRPLTIPALRTDRPLVLQTDPSFQRHPWFDKTRDGLETIARKLGLPGAEIRYAAGGVMTACQILENSNICYFKYPRSTESGGSLWDYAATACLFHEAGGIATDIHGQPMALNRRGSTFMNHHGLLYAATPELAAHIRALHRRLSAKTCIAGDEPDKI